MGLARGVAGAVVFGCSHTVPFALVVALQVASPTRYWPWLRVAATLAHRGVRRAALCAIFKSGTQLAEREALSPAAALLLRGLEPFSGPALFFLVAPPLLSRLAPPLVRTAVFYRHLFPVVAGYLRTLFVDAPATLKRTGSTQDAQAVWDARHKWGADRVHSMLVDLSGFYVKVGQVFATKADLIPPQYPRQLRRLFDACTPASFKVVRRTLERELGAPLESLFAEIDPEPLATATIAQVHRGRLHDGRQIVVKVQHEGMERLMGGDLRNMRRVCELLEWAQFDLNFDQVSVMREYEEQVPLEFDFTRERAMLERIGGSSARHSGGRVSSPASVPHLCTRRVLTMEFMDGVPFSRLQQALDAPEPRRLPPGASPAEMGAMLTDLLIAFGHQIFEEGVFHSDPHPGNLLRRPDGTVGLLDFGECKQLADRERLLFAKLTVALAQRHAAAALPLLAELGLEIEGATPEFAMVVAYICFDTRMDIKEAHMSPLDADAEEMRAVKLRTLPAELFMILRVVTIVRGMLALFKADVSAAQIWEPYARAALKAAGVEPPPPPPAATVASSALGGGVAAEGGEAGGIYERMYRLAEWMHAAQLPHDRKALTPCAMAGVTTVAELADADDAAFEKALKKFTPEQRERCRSLAREAVAQQRAAAERAALAAKKATAPAGARFAAAAARVKQQANEKTAKGRFAGAFAKLRASAT